MFKVTWIKYGELDFASSDFYEVVYSVFSHNIFYETCNGVKHILCCDFGGIFDELHNIVSSDEFQSEVPYEDGCGGDWYLFEYILNDEVVRQAGYIYGLERHEKIVSLIESCAKSILDDERKLLEHKCTNDEMQDIIKQRQELNADFFEIWNSITSKTISIPAGFIKCDNCKSIVHNKYYKNRKYWGRDWLSGEFGDYEVEYDSGECPVCGQLNTELPYTGIYCKPEEDLLGTDNKAFTIEPDENSNKLYTFDELKDLLKHISDEDKIKISSCQFKLFEDCPDDDTGDVYYDLIVYNDGNEIGKINMYYHSNTYFDIINREIKTTNDIPYYKYEMTLYEDSKEVFSNKDTGGFDIKAKWNPFDDSKFRCKKCGKLFCDCELRCPICGKVFCSCNKSFTRRGY